jgi:hypothetical protein
MVDTERILEDIQKRHKRIRASKRIDSMMISSEYVRFCREYRVNPRPSSVKDLKIAVAVAKKLSALGVDFFVLLEYFLSRYEDLREQNPVVWTSPDLKSFLYNYQVLLDMREKSSEIRNEGGSYVL